MRINECAIVLNRLSHKQSFVAWFSKDELYIKMLQNSIVRDNESIVLKYLHEAENQWKNKNWKNIIFLHELSYLQLLTPYRDWFTIYQIYTDIRDLCCTVQFKWNKDRKIG